MGRDIWIGSNCPVRAGNRIREGAVIGMGSVITKDVGAYEVWLQSGPYDPAKLP